MSLSTHILDAALGRPATNVRVVLEQIVDSVWQPVHAAYTDSDGRISRLVEHMSPGLYRLHFATAAYFELIGVTGLYPYVEVTFEVYLSRPGEPIPHYHIPLLLTPNSYTTYRGS